MTAVYVDQSLKKRHESSLIVSGLDSTESKSDTDQFAALCDTEFHIQPSIVLTKRLGRPQDGKIQPLLVVLKQVDQAKRIISSAKLLRRSADSIVRSRVFINPNDSRRGSSRLPSASAAAPGSAATKREQWSSQHAGLSEQSDSGQWSSSGNTRYHQQPVVAESAGGNIQPIEFIYRTVKLTIIENAI